MAGFEVTPEVGAAAVAQLAAWKGLEEAAREAVLYLCLLIAGVLIAHLVERRGRKFFLSFAVVLGAAFIDYFQFFGPRVPFGLAVYVYGWGSCTVGMLL